MNISVYIQWQVGVLFSFESCVCSFREKETHCLDEKKINLTELTHEI